MNVHAPIRDDVRWQYVRPSLYAKQRAAVFDPRRYSLIEASTKAGKAQPLDALVYTPQGPMRMGDVRVGQEVLTLDGRAQVVGVYPQGKREILRVTFSDGCVVEADAEHLWEVHQFRSSPVIVTTEQLQTWPTWRLRRAWVPALEQAAWFAPKGVTLDPYLVGALIGDGGMTSDSVMFSNADEFVLQEVARSLPDGHELKHSSRHDWRLTGGSGAAILREAKQSIRGMVRCLGIDVGSHQKFIPNDYRYNTAAVRLAVLQGIFDTDGSVDKHGQPVIEQTSEQLARDIEEVVQSLGGSVLTRLRPLNGYRAKDGRFVRCKPVWRQSIRMRDASQLFRLPRKKALCRVKRKSGNRMFRKIEFARHAEAQCIAVDDPRQLYLTDGLIPTHNTSACIIWLVEQALAGRDGQNFWWVAPVHNQAQVAFSRLVRALPRDMFQTHGTKVVRLANGATIWFKSADNPDTLYGDDVHAAVVDEASRMKEEAWYAVRSTLTATQGHVRIIGNVKGRKNWFYRLARRAEAGEQDMGYHVITATDAIDAGVFPETELDDARRSGMPEHVFRELYFAEPSDDGGNPFGQDAIAGCIGPMSKKPPKVWGWDLAKKMDYTVGIALDDQGRVCRFERFNQRPWPDTRKAIATCVGNTMALIDATGVGDPVLDELQRLPQSRYEGYIFTGPSKQRLMEGLQLAIQSGQVIYPDGPIVLELGEFTYEHTRLGVRYAAAPGSHDDCVCALALAWHHFGHAKSTYDATYSWL